MRCYERQIERLSACCDALNEGMRRYHSFLIDRFGDHLTTNERIAFENVIKALPKTNSFLTESET